MSNWAKLCAIVGLGWLMIIAAIGGSVPAFGARATTVTTMGSLQFIHAVDSMQPMSIAVNGKVRARGIPRLANTAPIVVNAGESQMQVSIGTGSNAVSSTVTVEVKPGSRRTVFFVGAPSSIHAVVTDSLVSDDPTPNDGTKNRSVQIVDLRAPASRSVITVSGNRVELPEGGIGPRMKVTGTLTVSVGSATPSPEITNDLVGPLLLAVTRAPDGDHVSAFRHNTIDVKTLRTTVALAKKTPGPGLLSLLVSVLVVMAATITAISSMLVFRDRMRDDNVRTRLARSLGSLS